MIPLLGSTCRWTALPDPDSVLRDRHPGPHRSRRSGWIPGLAITALSLLGPALAVAESSDAEPTLESQGTPPSEALLAQIEPSALRELAREVLARSPQVARGRHYADAVAALAPQRAALPDPVAGLTWFALPPETRVGPQRVGVSLSQRFPWAGKLKLSERAALWEAVASLGDLEQMRLDLITEVRRLFYELAFLREHESILRSERLTLERFEETARARYSAGAGLQQEILRIQAQITRTDERLLMLRERRSELGSRLNRLRDLPASAPLPEASLPTPRALDLDVEDLRRRAFHTRPDLSADQARIEQAKQKVELARKDKKPDFNVSLGYTWVERRQDQAGQINPPEDNGQDILSLSGAVNLPVHRGRLEAGLEGALSMQYASQEAQRGRMAEISSAVGDLVTRVPMLQEHWTLLDGVLALQAREALSSAETAYTTGNLNAVDLLDAEVVMLEVRMGVARTATDWAIAVAQLDGAVAMAVERIGDDHE